MIRLTFVFPAFITTASFIFLMVGCTVTNLPDSTHEDSRGTATSHITAPVTSEPDPLDGTHWELIALKNEGRTLSIAKQSQFFVEFAKGAFGLQGGCNSVGGHYMVEGNQITTTFARRTLEDCTETLGAEITRIEEAFAMAMPTFESYTIEDNQLRIRYADGELLFRRASD